LYRIAPSDKCVLQCAGTPGESANREGVAEIRRSRIKAADRRVKRVFIESQNNCAPA
jgi:hypothetical protein